MMDTEATLFTLKTMMKQEESSSYTLCDYFRDLPERTEKYGQPVDKVARQQIAEWCMNIMDACNYTREHAAITMNILDRFVSTSEGYKALLNRSEYQLASLTSVYLSVKIHAPQALSPDLVARLSQGSYTREDVETMERRILKALQWRVNPPTVMDFVRTYLTLIPSYSLDEETQKVIIELTNLQADLSVTEFNLSTFKASHVAFASLLNALEGVFHKDIEACDEFAELLYLATQINPDNLQILRGFLYEAILDKTDVDLSLTEKPASRAPLTKRMQRESSFAESPRSVLFNRHQQ
jgi:hypothetical protein